MFGQTLFPLEALAKLPLLSVGAKLSLDTDDARQGPRCGAIDSMCWVARQTCSAAFLSGPEKALRFRDAFLSN